ncbi:MAG: 4Fe-4S binding protein [ANME-2 cluster archaeon]|nr:4Fe-4S binding protein [ANME-2 cluster archaeon]MDF1557077.1 4Fe-4S binding protein [ANME-2 cluster archaeon]
MAKQDKKLVLMDESCIGCGICTTVCPTNLKKQKDINFDVDTEPRAIAVSNGNAFIDYDICVACGICTKNCPVSALIIEVLT